MAEKATADWRAVPQRMAAVQDLDDGWVATYQIDTSDGTPRVGEIRVRPRPKTRPTRPLSKRTLQRVDPAKAIKVVQTAVAADDTLATRIRDAIAAEPARPGRRGRGPWWWAAIALLYYQQTRAGNKRPVRAVAEAIGDGYGENYVRDALRRARDKGLISAPGQGTSGGQLTNKGIHALIDRDDFAELADLIHEDLVIRDFTEAEATALNAAIRARGR